MWFYLRNWAILIAMGTVITACSQPIMEDSSLEAGLQASQESPRIIGKIIDGKPTLLDAPSTYVQYFKSIYSETPREISLVELQDKIYLRGKYDFGKVYIHTTLNPAFKLIIIQHQYEDCLGACDCTLSPQENACLCDDGAQSNCTYDQGYSIF